MSWIPDACSGYDTRDRRVKGRLVTWNRVSTADHGVADFGGWGDKYAIGEIPVQACFVEWETVVEFQTVFRLRRIVTASRFVSIGTN